MYNWKMVRTYSDALPINQTQIFREMVRGMERGLGGKDEEKILQPSTCQP